MVLNSPNPDEGKPLSEKNQHAYHPGQAEAGQAPGPAAAAHLHPVGHDGQKLTKSAGTQAETSASETTASRMTKTVPGSEPRDSDTSKSAPVPSFKPVTRIGKAIKEARDARDNGPVKHGTGAATTARRTSTMSDAVDVPPAVIASGISVTGEEGPVYGPLDFEIPGQGLTILSGRGGSGRTALALTMTGRMNIKTGSLSVLGETKPAKIRRHAAICGVEDIDELDRDVRLRLVLTEHRAWSSPWITWVKRADKDYYEKICQPIFGDRDLPPLDAYVSQISALDRLLIRIALALNPANKHKIKLLVMDDLEQVHEFADRVLLVQILACLAEDLPVVVNSVNPLPDELMPDYTLIELFTDAAHIQPEHAGVDSAALIELQREKEYHL